VLNALGAESYLGLDMSEERITLYYRDGSSDKVYQASVEQVSGGWVVNFAYGRRGSALQSGTKTTTPVSYGQAKTIYDRLVKSKTGKGYTPGEDGVPFQATPHEARNSGLAPQLLNAIDSKELAVLMLNNRYVLQEKFDGRRTLIRLLNGAVEGINRTGLVVALPEPFAQAVARAGNSSFILDGELLGDAFVVFDLLEADGGDTRKFAYRMRLGLLQGLTNLYGPEVRLAETAFTSEEKRKLHQRLVAEGKEGVVVKDLDAHYVPGRPASGGSQLKYKFYETASFVVGNINNQRSVGLCLYRGSQLVPAGNVTIPPNAEVPHSGEVVEARYLYAFQESGVVYQPVFLHKREDILPNACSVGQLKFKPLGQ
jgi:bifunctional non-homologous end joining protein LigD